MECDIILGVVIVYMLLLVQHGIVPGNVCKKTSFRVSIYCMDFLVGFSVLIYCVDDNISCCFFVHCLLVYCID